MSSKSWKVKLSKQSESDLKYWYKTDKKIYKKVLKILEILETNPTNLNTIGKPEWLKGNLTGFMSRRINQVHRCVYQVFRKEKIIKVLQMRWHYDNR